MTTSERPARREVCHIEVDDRLWLRLLEESDARELYALIEANREHLTQWMPWAAGQTLDDTVTFIGRTREQLARNDGFQTAVVENHGIVGVVGFHGVSWQHRSTSIGYWLAASAQGRGVMTRAARALVDHALRTWLLHRVEIRAAVDNTRSRAIPERLGFIQEGVVREAERVGDRYADQALYAMLASDWRARSLTRIVGRACQPRSRRDSNWSSECRISTAPASRSACSSLSAA